VSEPCPFCYGDGWYVVTVGHEPSGPDDPGCHEEQETCGNCGGTGRVGEGE
jgi:hypothetical protein